MRKMRLAVIVSVCIASAPLFAEGESSINIYGNLYLFLGGAYQESYDTGESKETDQDLVYRIHKHSNLGFKGEYSKYGGTFELGLNDQEEDRKVLLRQAFGTYQLGFGKLMVGQAWAPYTKYSHESADYNRCIGYGAMYEDPILQIKMTTELGKLGIYLDLMKPYVPTKTYYDEESVDIYGSATTSEYRQVEVEREITTREPLDNIQSIVPKVAMGVNYVQKGLVLGMGVAGNVYRIEKTDEVTFNREWIYSYIAYANGSARFGMFEFNFSGGYSVNPANFGLTVITKGNKFYEAGAAQAVFNIATGEYEIKDTWNAQAFAELGLHPSGDMEIHMGCGMSMTEYGVENVETDYELNYYANIKINLGGLIALTPSVSYRDHMKDMGDNSEGKEIFVGVLSTVSLY